MNNQNNRAQVIQFLNNNNNQELTNAINDFNTAHNDINTLVNAIVECCEGNNIAYNDIANNVHVITEYLQNDDMVLSGDESLDSDIQPRINVQNIQPNIQPAVNVQQNVQPNVVQQNVVQPIANIQQNNIQPRQSRRLQGLAPQNNGLPQNGRSM